MATAAAEAPAAEFPSFETKAPLPPWEATSCMPALRDDKRI
jgi:hypothetical protein